MRAIPRGNTLPVEVWERRQRWLLRVLLAHVCALPVLALALGYPLLNAAGHVAPVIAMTLLARYVRAGHRVRSAITSAGLMTCSAVLVQMTHGLTEAHFHFFVMVALLTLYEDWPPLLVALGYVLVYHGLLGLIETNPLYPHSGSPLLWAAIHGGFVAAAAAANVVAWRLNEDVRAQDRESRDEVLDLASHDALTGLANRELTAVRLREALAEISPRAGSVAVLHIEIDDFENINDAFGREDADRVLIEVARRLKSQLRLTDTLGRIGGNEFIGVCRGVNDRPHPREIGMRISRAFEEPVKAGGHSRTVSCSVGIAVAAAGDDDPDGLVRDADAALQQAKTKGRSRIQVADAELLSSAAHRLSIQGELELAVEEQSLSLHYQPIVDLRKGALCGVEALLRWQHPTLGLIPAAELMPVADAAGLSVPIGHWVLRTACRQAASWRSWFPGSAPLKVFANVSPREVTHSMFLDTVRSALADAGLAPGLLVLELTEHSLMEERGAVRTLTTLQEMGVGIALDDFGTGHSSLSHLARFPVEVLKLDRSFVSGDPGCEGAAPILDAVVSMAGGLGLPIVAEGIETGPQLESLRARGFELGQGHYFMRPAPAESITALLAEFRPFAPLIARAGSAWDGVAA